MSSELERWLRQARETLPEPGEASTMEARERALLAAFERKRRRVRTPFAVALALVLAVALGVGIGAFVTPSGSAAEGPPGLGFLPEKGWHVLQSGTDATPEQPAVVIVANFTGRRIHEWYGAPFPEQKLPLRVSDATPYIEWGGQIRPEQPLAQYQLRAEVEDYAVDIHFYFGTPEASEEHLAAAQRQLDRLVVQPSPSDRARRPRDDYSTWVPVDALAKRVDRTLLCRTVVTTGPLRDLNIVVNPRDSSAYTKLPAHVSVTSGRHTNLTPDLVAVRSAGWRDHFGKRFPAGVYTHAAQCDEVSSAVRLSPTGLPGPPAVWGRGTECGVRGRVLIRVRAVFQSSAPWRRLDRTYAGARGAVREAELAVVDQRTRKPLAYAELESNGKTRFWKASRCT